MSKNIYCFSRNLILIFLFIEYKKWEKPLDFAKISQKEEKGRKDENPISPRSPRFYIFPSIYTASSQVTTSPSLPLSIPISFLDGLLLSFPFYPPLSIEPEHQNTQKSTKDIKTKLNRGKPMEEGKTPSSFSISNLMCQEDSTDLDCSIEPESHRKISISPLGNEIFSETEEKYIERLVSKEMCFCTMYRACSSSCYEDYSSVFVEDWFKSVRFDAVQWILRVSCFIKQYFMGKILIIINQMHK
jgi:hypothetical protein